MKIKTKKVMYVLFCVFIFFMSVLSHELAHQEIYSSYDIDSKLHLTYVQPFNECPNESCELAHNIIEIIDLASFPFLLFFMVAFYFLIFKEEKE